MYTVLGDLKQYFIVHNIGCSLMTPSKTITLNRVLNFPLTLILHLSLTFIEKYFWHISLFLYRNDIICWTSTRWHCNDEPLYLLQINPGQMVLLWWQESYSSRHWGQISHIYGILQISRPHISVWPIR